MGNQYYDNTTLSDHRRCNRLGYYRHRRSWVPESTSPPLIFGLCWHEAMDVVWGGSHTDVSDRVLRVAAFDAFLRKWDEETDLDPDNLTKEQQDFFKHRIPITGHEMLGNYIEVRRPFIRECEIVAIEQPFAVPLDPEDPSLLYIGRLDKVIKHNGGIVIVEHKTTSAYSIANGFQRTFIESFSPNSQVDGYHHAGRMFYGKIKSLWVDAALVHKRVHDAFKFIPVDRDEGHLSSWLWEARHEITQIRENDKRREETGGQLPFLPAFGKNTQSCGHYGGCPYMGLCKTLPNPDKEESPPPGFIERKWEPFEVLNLEEIGFQK